MTIIFKANSPDAYHIKILIELLSCNIKTGCFEIDAKGMYLCMMDQHRKILLDVVLNADDFSLYKFNSEKMYLGINLNHLHKLTRSIKKKDKLELFIDDDFPTELNIKVIPKENDRSTVSTVKIQNIQNLVVDRPTGYGKPITVISSHYSKMCKELNTIGSSLLEVSAKKYNICFYCNQGGILKRKVNFGHVEEDESDVINKGDYFQEFYTEQLCRISKIAGLSNNIKIYPGKPLKFNSNIGTLGKIDIYIKSKEQIQSEVTIDPDNYDSD
jgi:hypothetical protein